MLPIRLIVKAGVHSPSQSEQLEAGTSGQTHVIHASLQELQGETTIWTCCSCRERTAAWKLFWLLCQICCHIVAEAAILTMNTSSKQEVVAQVHNLISFLHTVRRGVNCPKRISICLAFIQQGAGNCKQCPSSLQLEQQRWKYHVVRTFLACLLDFLSVPLPAPGACELPTAATSCLGSIGFQYCFETGAMPLAINSSADRPERLMAIPAIKFRSDCCQLSDQNNFTCVCASP